MTTCHFHVSTSRYTHPHVVAHALSVAGLRQQAGSDAA